MRISPHLSIRLHFSFQKFFDNATRGLLSVRLLIWTFLSVCFEWIRNKIKNYFSDKMHFTSTNANLNWRFYSSIISPKINVHLIGTDIFVQRIFTFSSLWLFIIMSLKFEREFIWIHHMIWIRSADTSTESTKGRSDYEMYVIYSWLILFV